MGAPAAAPAAQQLLKSKRPLGRRQLGSDAANWLREELAVKADEYLENVKDAKLWKNEDEKFAEKQEDLAGRAMFATFSPQRLSEHLEQRLRQKAPSPPPEGFVLAAQHRPTVWTTFQLVVQTKLQRDGKKGEDALAWQESAEWRIFGRLQRQVSPKKAGSAAKRQEGGERSQASQAKPGAKQRKQGSVQRPRKPAAGEGARNGGALRLKGPQRLAASEGSPRVEGGGKGATSGRRGGKNEPWQGGATLEKRGDAGRSAAAKSRDLRAARRRDTRVAAARARDAARRATLERPVHRPYGKKDLGKEATAWLIEASEVCAREYIQIVQRVRTDQLSGLVDVLGSGTAGTNAVLLALNTEVVSAQAVTQAAALLGGEDATADAAEAAEATQVADAAAATADAKAGGTDASPRDGSDVDLALPLNAEAAQIREEADLMFRAADANGDGEISRLELQQYLGEAGYAVAQIDEIFDALDVNSDDAISQEELRKGFALYMVAGEAGEEGKTGEAAEFERLIYERILTTIRPCFAPLPLVQRSNAVLGQRGPQPPCADGAAGVDLCGHVPTLWSFFTRSVRVQLEAELGERWSRAAEWRALLALYAEFAGKGAVKGVRWQLGETSVWRRPPQPDDQQQLFGSWRLGGAPLPADEAEAARDDAALRPIGSWSSRRSRKSAGGGATPAGLEGKVVRRRQRVRRAAPLSK